MLNEFYLLDALDTSDELGTSDMFEINEVSEMLKTPDVSNVSEIDENIPPKTHTGERPYKCDSCSYRFATKGNLIIHTKHIYFFSYIIS